MYMSRHVKLKDNPRLPPLSLLICRRSVGVRLFYFTPRRPKKRSCSFVLRSAWTLIITVYHYSAANINKKTQAEQLFRDDKKVLFCLFAIIFTELRGLSNFSFSHS